MTRIVNIGEALIDEITRPHSEPVEVVGGSMLNVAAGLTRLGHESELATWFARDARGDKVRAHAEAAGVTLTPGSDGAEFTTVAHAAVDEKGHATYEFDLTWDVPAVEEPDTVGPVHPGHYAAERNIYGNYAVSISPELICCYDAGSNSIRQLSEVEEWRRILAL